MLKGELNSAYALLNQTKMPCGFRLSPGSNERHLSVALTLMTLGSDLVKDVPILHQLVEQQDHDVRLARSHRPGRWTCRSANKLFHSAVKTNQENYMNYQLKGHSGISMNIT